MFERIPVYIISGFLGSGKTTLLNSLLKDYPKSAVIINEFGVIPVDQQLLREHQAPLSTLVGGCLCCQVIGALTPLLKNLRLAWEQDHSLFERIVIETSGVASPEPVLDIILRERWLSKRYSLQGIWVTVSATLAVDYLAQFPEAQAQIAWADTLLMTQTDLATLEQTTQLEARLTELAPSAKRLIALNGEVDQAQLFGRSPKFRPLPDMTQPLPEHGFDSITVLVKPVAWTRLERALLEIMQVYRAGLVRVKGMVFTPNEPAPLLIQGTGERLYPPVRMPERISDDGIGRLVFITQGQVGHLAEVFTAHLSQTGTHKVTTDDD